MRSNLSHPATRPLGLAALGGALLALAGWSAGVARADVTLAPAADAYVRSDTPTTNYGTTKEIRARGGGNLVINGFVRFAVQGVGAVSAATLRVYVTDASPSGTGSVVRVTDNTWSETGILWPGPAATGQALDSEPAGSALGTWIAYDVSAFVTGDGTYSFELQNSVSDAVYYSSKEGSNAPQLVLTTGAGTAPTNQTQPSISGTPQVGQTLHANPGAWGGTGPITYGYQWQRCASDNCSPIQGADQQDYTLAPGDLDATIRVQVTATGAVAPPGVAVSIDVGPVINTQQTPPTYTQLPTISGLPQQGQSLHASPGQWSGTGPITYAYLWRRCSGATCVDIANPGPDPHDYLLISDDVGSTIQVKVTATGAVAPPGVATSAQVGPITPFSGGAGVTLMTAGDIACDPTSSSFKGGNGTSSKCREKATSDLLLAGNPDAVLPLGDLQYENATLSDFQASYDISWGRSAIAGKTYPVVGNHEYQTSGASGYYTYWQQKTGQDSAHQATKGYYSFNLGTWHVIVLNSNCSPAGGCGTSSPQGTWLLADLQAHPTGCTIAAWHHPLFNGTKNGTIKTNSAFKPLWDLLYQYGAEIVLNGHVHHYERFDPLTPGGGLDLSAGIREFIVGTGGIEKGGSASPVGNLKVVAKTYGVLKLVLGSGTYSWQFLPAAGESFTDAGSGSCH